MSLLCRLMGLATMANDQEELVKAFEKTLGCPMMSARERAGR